MSASCFNGIDVSITVIILQFLASFFQFVAATYLGYKWFTKQSVESLKSLYTALFLLSMFITSLINGIIFTKLRKEALDEETFTSTVLFHLGTAFRLFYFVFLSLMLKSYLQQEKVKTSKLVKVSVFIVTLGLGVALIIRTIIKITDLPTTDDFILQDAAFIVASFLTGFSIFWVGFKSPSNVSKSKKRKQSIENVDRNQEQNTRRRKSKIKRMKYILNRRDLLVPGLNFIGMAALNFLLKILPLSCENDKSLDETQTSFRNHSLINVMKIFGVIILTIVDNIKNNVPTETIIQPTFINPEFSERKSKTRKITKKQGSQRKSKTRNSKQPKKSVTSDLKRRENYVLEYIEAS